MICQAFYEAVRKNDPKLSVAVIIDNSPGYIGIAPAVQEWLTDLGPKLGKFLTVSSLDRQDLLACGYAVYNLHQLDTLKWNAAKKFRNAKEDESALRGGLNLVKEEEGFFLRLVETSPTDSDGIRIETASFVNGAGLHFYHESDAVTGEAYRIAPEKYQDLILNRVPPQVKLGKYRYNLERIYHLMRGKGGELLWDLLGEDRGTYVHKMVGHDQVIESQFWESSVSQNVDQKSSDIPGQETDALFMRAQQSISSSEVLVKAFEPGASLNHDVFEKLRSNLRDIDDSIIKLIDFIEKPGLFDLMRFIRSELLLGSVFRDYGKAILDALSETDFPFVRDQPEDFFYQDRLGAGAWHVIERFRGEEKRYISAIKGGATREITEQLLPSMVIVTAFSGSYRWLSSSSVEDVFKLFWLIIASESFHWSQLKDRSRKRLSIPGFLASESQKGRMSLELNEFVQIDPRLPKVEIPVLFPERKILDLLYERGLLDRLYRKCASAQARIIDARQDAEFLIALLRRLVTGNIQEGPILRHIREIADNVIVRKTLSHAAGLETISEGVSSAKYMEEFSSILGRILEKWEEGK